MADSQLRASPTRAGRGSTVTRPAARGRRTGEGEKPCARNPIRTQPARRRPTQRWRGRTRRLARHQPYGDRMSLKEQLQSDLTTAMKARDELRASTLRMALTAITTEEVAGKKARQLSDNDVVK